MLAQSTSAIAPCEVEAVEPAALGAADIDEAARDAGVRRAGGAAEGRAREARAVLELDVPLHEAPAGDRHGLDRDVGEADRPHARRDGLGGQRVLRGAGDAEAELARPDRRQLLHDLPQVGHVDLDAARRLERVDRRDGSCAPRVDRDGDLGPEEVVDERPAAPCPAGGPRGSCRPRR